MGRPSVLRKTKSKLRIRGCIGGKGHHELGMSIEVVRRGYVHHQTILVLCLEFSWLATPVGFTLSTMIGKVANEWM